MKHIRLAIFAASLALSAAPATASATQTGASQTHEISHGGGCRKSSPPGQCCHMDNSVGEVHCH